MANKMLIDATHPEETRVVVVRGNRVEEFDFEAANRRPLRGNIYLAKVTRVEPSLQACFVDYGGNRHGFLAFSEIHPDYYQIPVADRQALLAEEAREARAAESEEPRGRRERTKAKAAPPSELISEMPVEDAEAASEPSEQEMFAEAETSAETETGPVTVEIASADDAPPEGAEQGEPHGQATPQVTEESDADSYASEYASEEVRAPESEAPEAEASDANGAGDGADAQDDQHDSEEEIVESVGADDAMEEVPERHHRPRRHYKIQEVIKRRQVMLVQVVKEERGTKGAAMTTYLSLAGRYSVLMPNTSRGGGISRKITDGADRKRLKELVQDLEVPEGMGVILRTAGAARTKAEIKRDYEYLLRLWETVRELTLKSSAPALVYEEGSLIKRAIRDLYNKDIDEVMVAGEEGHRDAKEFMRMLMPSHAKNVKLYKDPQPLFVRYGVESQLDAMFSPVVQLKSGGYVVINPTEALVAIDVNSGRSTREHHIEDTALRTNLEAAEEVARQLRLRDLAGLIVIDFIDMEQKRNNRSVERMLKDCLKHDRARIQVGRISHFGLMEMSRQRIRTGVLESSTVICPHCGGTGHVRSISSVALHLLRSLEEQLVKSSSHDLVVRTRADVALYLLNQKRAHLRELEQRFGVNILIQADTTLAGQQYFAVDRGPPARSPSISAAPRIAPDTILPTVDEDEDEVDAEPEDEMEAASGTPAPTGEERGEPGRGRRRRRRRRGRGRGREGQEHAPLDEPRTSEQHIEQRAAPSDEGEEEFADETSGAFAGPNEPERTDENGGPRRRRRRGRRGGRRNRRDRREPQEQETFSADAQQDAVEEIPGAPEHTEAEHAETEHPETEHAETGGGDPFRSVTEPTQESAFAPREASEPTPAQPQPEQPKRRSTVREPVSFHFDEMEPAAPSRFERHVEQSEPAREDSEQSSDQGQIAPERPRRSGWWQRR